MSDLSRNVDLAFHLATVYREALEKIKRHVCGEATPNWSNDMKTTGSRLYIADVIDAALASDRATR